MFGLQPQDDNVHIVGSPLYHTAVLVFGGGALHLGHTVVLMDKWSPEEMLRLIEKHRVTSSHMVPTPFHRLLALPDELRAKYDLTSLRPMLHAAAPCAPDAPAQSARRTSGIDTAMMTTAAASISGKLVSCLLWPRIHRGSVS